jgi:hypothetical protein
LVNFGKPESIIHILKKKITYQTDSKLTYPLATVHSSALRKEDYNIAFSFNQSQAILYEENT